VDRQAHWERIYRAKATTELSWYQSEATLSVELIQRVAPQRDNPIIDVGGGTSPLVDGLLSAGYTAVRRASTARRATRRARHRRELCTGRPRALQRPRRRSLHA
jgi:hypothetical protein